MREPDRLIVDRSPGETRIAALADGILTDLWVERTGLPRSRRGEIALARVTAVRPELNAAFLDIGKGEAFLNLGKRKAPAEGALLPVTVTADAAGRKQAQASRQISLSGRFMSLRPTESDLSIAGAIKAKGKRDALKEMLEPGRPADVGLLVHENADGAEKLQLIADLTGLLKEWKSVEDAIAAGDGPKPIRLAPRPEETACVLFPSAPVAESSGGTGFEADDIDTQIERALARRLVLPNGTALTFDDTEALVAIDVDLAGAARAPNGWARLFEEMAPSIASEIRLRRLSGLVLIDFPRLSQKSDKDRIAAAMQAAFEGWPLSGGDNAQPPQVLGWTRSGVLEVTVQRVGRSLAEDYLRPAERHPRAATVALTALRRLLRETNGIARPEILCAPDIADWLAGPGAEALAEVNRKLGGALQVTAQPDYALERIEIGPARR
ncbi:ribonuclease E/G [Nisaea acidiphila]|uniref:Ribonuclease E/G n=1 Tax=Nisaea acidiphila TaxID=1862145 RepID=A0A9J7AY60_9PROT|nr:ribonuclease E/G [Nisaea acidiphila]UUX51369.1 ribonuclease E/G [Nisaea acidiphila]